MADVTSLLGMRDVPGVFSRPTGSPVPPAGGTSHAAPPAGLPTFEVEIGGEKVRLYRRLPLVAEAGVIAKAFYPVFPPDRDAAAVLAWLDGRDQD